MIFFLICVHNYIYKNAHKLTFWREIENGWLVKNLLCKPFQTSHCFCSVYLLILILRTKGSPSVETFTT